MSMSPKCVNVCVCNTCLQHTMIQCPKTHKSPFKMTLLANLPHSITAAGTHARNFLSLALMCSDAAVKVTTSAPPFVCVRGARLQASSLECWRQSEADREDRLLPFFLNTWWEYKHPQMRALIMARQFCYASLGVKPLWGTSAGCCDISGVYILLRKWTKRRIASQGGVAWCGRGI